MMETRLLLHQMIPPFLLQHLLTPIPSFQNRSPLDSLLKPKQNFRNSRFQFIHYSLLHLSFQFICYPQNMSSDDYFNFDWFFRSKWHHFFNHLLGFSYHYQIYLESYCLFFFQNQHLLIYSHLYSFKRSSNLQNLDRMKKTFGATPLILAPFLYS